MTGIENVPAELADTLAPYTNIVEVPANVRFTTATLAVMLVRDGSWSKQYAAQVLTGLGLLASPEKVAAAANTTGPSSWWLVSRLTGVRWSVLERDCPTHGRAA